MDSKAHWDRVYRNTAPNQVSWYQAEAQVSLGLIRQALPDLTSAIVDVGGGAASHGPCRGLGALDTSPPPDPAPALLLPPPPTMTPPSSRLHVRVESQRGLVHGKGT